ncbi:3-dehydroquinate synthase [candidate division KSB3 bacterium]|uniref:3-dehydroquinate synthase n=1 Tax=candidate division KSB3 bacterium TaxID=2044937 RepID=A0A2G6KD96_9BACT|nr:MAG: 3-dehydroquinate synthase [candidate division KSB3 bacterium]
MHTYTITGSSGKSHILLGESLSRLTTYIKQRPCILVTDDQVYPLYRDYFPECPVVVIGTGEGIKTLETLHTIYQQCLDADLDRSALIVAIGGGIVCDIAGFAASTYLRGLQFGFVPTTLLAQVDASVGGKNGVNFQGYKNLIGTFTQPEFVLIDFTVLKTLPPRTLGCGIAEAIKHGAIADPDLFEFMEHHAINIRQLLPEAIERIVHDSITIKSSIVNQDEKEHGERRKLNFGHTFGHAIEKTLKLPHGESVALGMVTAAQLSQQRGYLSCDDVQRLVTVLKAYDLPTTVAADKTALKTAMRKDKKRYGNAIKFILLTQIGQSTIERVSLKELEMVVDRL